jgi:ubiquinone/menaquinone biosynthesis C-methylase UbiE
VGRAFAESVGYPRELLDSIPAAAAEGFAGVSNVAVFADIAPGARVLDLGCGSGLDAIIAARRVGESGKVLGVDFSQVMLGRAREAAAATAAGNLEFRHADAERLPLPDASVDVALVNGIFNLNPDRAGIFRELARVVRPGGSAYCAELILIEPLPPTDTACPANWFA